MLGEYLGAGSGTTKGLYRLNGDSSDSSGNGNNGTATNITWVSEGVGGGSASFNGSNSKIVVSSNLYNSSNFTTIVNLKTNTLPSPGGVYYISVHTVDFGTGCGAYIENSGGTYYLRYINYLTSGNKVLSTIFPFLAGTKYEITYVTGVSGMSLYVDGNLKASNSNTGILRASANSFGIGAYPSGGGYNNGLIDEVIIENRVWTAEEIKKYYTYTQGRFGIL